MAPPSSARLATLFDHIVLPTRLPQEEDLPDSLSTDLLGYMRECAQEHRKLVAPEYYEKWTSITRALETCSRVHDEDRVSAFNLEKALKDLTIEDQLIIVFIRDQNAAITIRRSATNAVFEIFEASARTDDVMASPRLEWSFPASSVQLPLATIQNPSYCAQLSQHLEQASTEYVHQFSPKSSSHVLSETREAAGPDLIAQNLRAVLEVSGERLTPTLIKKRIRDDVVWKSADKPWRRSPVWLVLRVALQRHLYHLFGQGFGYVQYKTFLVSVIRRICDDFTAGDLAAEKLAMARAKLARRMAKLEMHRNCVASPIAAELDQIIPKIERSCQRTLDNANRKLEESSRTFILDGEKRIRGQAKVGADDPGLTLSLSNSRPHILHVLSHPLDCEVADTPSVVRSQRERARFQFSSETHQLKFEGTQTIESHLRLFDFEMWVEHQLPSIKDMDPTENDIIRLSQVANQYIKAAPRMHDSDSVQMSKFLLVTFELWLVIDRWVVKKQPLLKEYSTQFPMSILGALNLPSKKDLTRLQAVESALMTRERVCKPLPSIFDAPSSDSLSVRYFAHSSEMQDLLNRIEARNIDEEKDTEALWNARKAEYENYNSKYINNSCVYTNGEHDFRNCVRCFGKRRRRRVTMTPHEALLPTDPVQAHALVFELIIPNEIAVWRDLTWTILFDLAHATKPEPSAPPKQLLREHSPLCGYMNGSRAKITLASSTKPLMKQHYGNDQHFPLPNLSEVIFECNLKLAMYDLDHNTSAKLSSSKQSFYHLCDRKAPAESPFHGIHSMRDSSPNQIMARQTLCPSGVNITEFNAYQEVARKGRLQWVHLLRELESSNLSFGSEALLWLVTQVMQAGPRNGDDILRQNHWVFADDAFCSTLLHVIDSRMETIASNWRETRCMEVLMLMCRQVWSLAQRESTRRSAENVIRRMREILLTNIRTLRHEMGIAKDSKALIHRSKDAFYVALICRLSFFVDAEPASGELSFQDTSCFVECSIALKENMSEDFSMTNLFTRASLARDVKIVATIQDKIIRSIDAKPTAVDEAINQNWPSAEGQQIRKFSNWKLVKGSDSWVSAHTIVPNQTLRQQQVHFDIFDGNLLIDGRYVGRLPDTYRKQPLIQTIVEHPDQPIMICPSDRHGMSYLMRHRFHGYAVYFGLRKGKLIVWAVRNEKVLELLPAHVFEGPNVSSPLDLPLSLINDFTHWLDRGKQRIHILQRTSDISKLNRGWVIDLTTGQAFRQKRDKNTQTTSKSSVLLDPQSSLFEKLARIFGRIENPQHMTIYRPKKEGLTIDLLRVELRFHLREEDFYCRQLDMVVDRDQEIGTLHGLENKLVLRDSKNEHDRLVLVPRGPVSIGRPSSGYCRVNIKPVGQFCRFSISRSRSRLDCASEPELLYFKAYPHALTSLPLPDALTGRTGIEESIHILNSAQAQPWTPLDETSLKILALVASLSPRREWYPKGFQMMQTVHWNSELSTSSQSSQLRPLVEDIVRQSNDLTLFAPHQPSRYALPPKGEQALLERAILRGSVYEPADLASTGRSQTKATRDGRAYVSRAEPIDDSRFKNTFEAAARIEEWSPHMPVCRNLVKHFEQWGAVGGFVQSFNKFSFGELLETSKRLPVEWGAIFRKCQESGAADLHSLMFTFAIIAFQESIDMTLVRTLITVAISDADQFTLPADTNWPSYDKFKDKEQPTRKYLVAKLEQARIPYPGDDRGSDNQLSAHARRQLERAEQQHLDKSEAQINDLATHFLEEQWPCPEPKRPTGFDHVNLDLALEVLQSDWARLYHNLELAHHAAAVQARLGSLHADYTVVEFPSGKTDARTYYKTFSCAYEAPSLSNLLEAVDTANMDQVGNPSIDSVMESHVFVDVSKQRTAAPIGNRENAEVKELRALITQFRRENDSLRSQYVSELLQSLDALAKKQHDEASASNSLKNESVLSTTRIQTASLRMKLALKEITKAIAAGDARHKWLDRGGLWVRVTPEILRYLSASANCKLSNEMRAVLIAYGMRVLLYQYLLRVTSVRKADQQDKLCAELANYGHSNWDPAEYPDWLLIEIESNILIRPIQVEVAKATISPASKSNALLQLNMGEGKSSIIIPMVVAVLADRKRLTRVIVPRNLLYQTAGGLQARISGLIGRKVKHVPFTRRTKINKETVILYDRIHHDMVEHQGVIVALPEHNMSFKLKSQEALSAAEAQNTGSSELARQAKPMVQIQRWLDKCCRDLIDESDYILEVKTQLLYPFGSLQPPDGSPKRWKTIEAVLGVVMESSISLFHSKKVNGLNVIVRPSGGFPIIHLLSEEAETTLMRDVAESIVFRGRDSLLPTQICSPEERVCMLEFICNVSVNEETARKVLKLSNAIVKKDLLLLRGLIAYRIMSMSLKKRWNVQYGLHPDRPPMAVPFSSKGVPSETAEFGHPDVALLLSILAFEHQGLNIPQLTTCLQLVLKADDPGAEFALWVESSSLPDSLKEWRNLNLEDRSQVEQLFHYFAHNSTAINYFVNNVVFPKHARTFEKKLQASAWDIPSFEGAPRSTIAPSGSGSLTTGFSGTNDNRHLLPLTIQQQDLKSLVHTNSKVLTQLLEPRNRRYVHMKPAKGPQLFEEHILQHINAHGIRIFIDAGATILEMSNEDLARKWLSEAHERPAAVYFGRNDQLFVIHQDGRRQTLFTSPFANRLDECLVYFDEAHTRGVDLRLPRAAKGALTLGLEQTKDHTVQAAMRLRQLGSTQQVTFFAPPEVHAEIQALRKARGANVTETPCSADVIYWTWENTCKNIKQYQPLFVSQGLNFCERVSASFENPHFLDNANHRERYVRALEQPEEYSLRQLYYPETQKKHAERQYSLPALNSYAKELDEMRNRFQGTVTAVQAYSVQEAEQEREMEVEVEQVRQIQKPAHMKAQTHELHRDVEFFAEFGTLTSNAECCRHVSDIMAKETEAGSKKHRIDPAAIKTNLYATKDFQQTVELGTWELNDFYLRDVNWILWSEESQTAMIISPFEAEKLLPTIRHALNPKCFLLTYAAPVTRKMLQFEGLNFYIIPRAPYPGWKAPEWLIHSVGLFAGRLYFSFDHYENLRKFFSPPISGIHDKLCEEPLQFLQQWLSARRKGAEFTHTPMGYLVEGKRLTAQHPFFQDETVQTADDDGGIDQASALQEHEMGDVYDDSNDDGYDEPTVGGTQEPRQ
ncbi:MAG: hypothetical protein M1831_001542 [Alyxoria varia]|nr:MAG: hypothetical protein M1831_001542 [Alyxoria varia]